MRSEQEILAELQGLLGSDPNIAPDVPTTPFRTDITQATGRGSSEKFIDPAGMQTEGQIKNDLEVAAQKQKEMDKANIKRQDFTKELGSFFSVDEAIPRGDGYFRFAEGLKSLGSAIGQEDLRGIAVSAHDAASKKLRVSIARLKDVGNLSETEQRAAEQMIPGIFDSEKLVTLKRAYLKQLGEGIDSNSPDLVKQTMDSFMKSGDFKPEKVGPSQVQAKGSRFKVEME
jgi:hypothetical protein